MFNSCTITLWSRASVKVVKIVKFVNFVGLHIKYIHAGNSILP